MHIYQKRDNFSFTMLFTRVATTPRSKDIDLYRAILSYVLNRLDVLKTHLLTCSSLKLR